jgi:UPF0176 protein
MAYHVVAFYRFVTLNNLPELQTQIKNFCAEHNLCGITLLAPEGVNGTMAGSPEAIKAMINLYDTLFGINLGEVKYSNASIQPFKKSRIRLKKEIITMKRPEADPTKLVGVYVPPKEWNDIISQPDVLVVDTRNHYETALGMFEGAIDPKTQYFTQFPEFVEKHLDPKKHTKLAMYCTGDIRCEKASAYMLAHGFKEVYHLKGGILKYLEEVPPEQSKWQGACYVFDRRQALGHGLQEERYLASPISHADDYKRVE